MVHLRFQFGFGVEICVWAGLEVFWMRELKEKNPENLGSRRSAAVLFLGAATQGCFQSGEAL